MFLLLLILTLGRDIVGHANLDHLKIAAVIEHSKYHDGLIDLKEYICHRINMRVTFEMYNVSSRDSVFLDGLVHDVVRKDVDLILWLVSCEMLDFLPNKVSSEAVMLFLTEEKCPTSVQVERGEAGGGGLSQKFQALADAIRYLKWPDVKIFYDESINGTEVLMLTNELSSRYVRSALFRIDSSTSFTDKIRRTFIAINQKAFSENRYLMILKKQTLEVVIEEAASLWMLVNRNYWIAISDDMDVKSLIRYGLNPRNNNLVIFKDACDICREDLKPVEEATNEIQFAGQLPEETIRKHILTIVCLMVKLSEKSETFKSVSNCSNFTKFLANVTGFAVPKNYSTFNHSCYTAYEMKTVKEGPLLTSTVARWRLDTGLFVMREFYPNEKYRLGNITLNVSTLTLLPYAVMKTDRGKIDFEGFCIMILKELSQQMNFSYAWVVPKDREFGMKANGSFTGLVGLLQKRETDMVIGPLTLTQERGQVIDYTYPYAEEGRGMLIKRPGNSSTGDLFKVFYVFDHASWVCCLSVIFIVSVFLTVIDGLHKMSDSHNSIKGLPDSGTVKTICLFSKLNWSEILWSIFTIYVSQNGAWEPKHIRSRIIVLSWWIFTIFITTYFTANLTAYFTVTIQISSIENLKDLADDKDILPVTLGGSAIYTEFKNRKDAVGQEIFHQLQRAPEIKNAADSLDYVRTGKYVLISLWSEVKLYAARYCHEFIVPGNPFTLKTIGFGLQKGSALTAEVSHFLNLMREAGLIEKWRQQSWASEYVCSTSETSIYKPTPLSMNSLGGIYIIFGSIVLLSTLCFLLEIFVFDRNKRKRIPLNYTQRH